MVYGSRYVVYGSYYLVARQRVRNLFKLYFQLNYNGGHAIGSCFVTLESGIDIGQGINVGPGKLGKKNKRRALNTHVLCSE